LDVAATQGLLGLGALALVLATLLRGVLRWRFSASVGPLGAACIGYSVWVLFNFDWAPATGIFWLLAGAAWSGARAAEANADLANEADEPPRVRQPALRSMAAAGLVVAATWFGAMPVLADVWYHQSRLDLSVAVDPLQARYHWALGQGLVALDSPARGLEEMLRAAQLGESDPQIFVDIGDTEQGLGRTADAQAAYRMALTIDPFYTPARQRLAGIGLPASG